jgi:hypothetical protein
MYWTQVIITRACHTICLQLLISSLLFAQEPITEKNWLTHPDIVEVRSLYETIKEAKEAGKLGKRARTFEYCEPYQDTERTLYSEQDGTPRIYHYRGGSDDSAVEIEIYYDEHGRRRFAFIVAGAVNGTRLEHRVYFSKAGKKIWESQKLVEGPGYTFPANWPEEQFSENPTRAFKATNPCPEKK